MFGLQIADEVTSITDAQTSLTSKWLNMKPAVLAIAEKDLVYHPLLAECKEQSGRRLDITCNNWFFLGCMHKIAHVDLLLHRFRHPCRGFYVSRCILPVFIIITRYVSTCLK
jgi:hypothetical protein